MFRTATNPFDEVVSKSPPPLANYRVTAKATDENLTSENWELILDVCDQVSSKPEDGPRDAIAAVIKRFAHRNANVQLYSLTLAESLGKNCGTKVHRELASRPFTQAIVRLVNDRTTHATVKSRAFELVQQWTDEFKSDPSLSIMDETLRQLKSSNPNLQPPSRPSKHEITDADRKKEEEELQMALALSLSDVNISQPSASKSQTGATAPQQQKHPQQQPQPVQKPQTTAATVSRVKALYDFSPSEPGELPFRRGDIISVLDSVYKDWWRGSLRGQVGIFPVNYVEILKDATPEELIREAEEEAKILAEGRNIEKLLGLLANAEGGRAVEDEELQVLYNSTLAIRPKLVKLIEKYSMRKDELIALNETFNKARHDYDVLMESSMSRYSRPAPAPSTNPFNHPPALQGPSQPPIHRPHSGFGSGANANASPSPTANNYGPNPAYPPQNWDGYQPPEQWDTAKRPQPEAGSWGEPQPQPPPNQAWESHQLDHQPGQWSGQYQQWEQERPSASSGYVPPTQTQPYHYGGGLDELANPPPSDKPQQWYDGPPGPPTADQPHNPPSALHTSGVGAGGFATQTPAYFSPPSKPDGRQDQPPYPYNPPSDQGPYLPTPPKPSQPPPAIPFDQKPQKTTPYPVGRGQPPASYLSGPKPATYDTQGSDDRYASLRSLSPSSNNGGWYSSPERNESETKPSENTSGGGYYGVNT